MGKDANTGIKTGNQQAWLKEIAKNKNSKNTKIMGERERMMMILTLEARKSM